MDIAVAGTRALAAEGGRVTLLDVTYPAAPALVGSATIDIGEVNRVALDESTGLAVTSRQHAQWFAYKGDALQEKSKFANLDAVAVLCEALGSGYA